MASGGFELNDVVADGSLDEAALEREAARFVDRWTAADVRRAATRTKRLAVAGVVALVLRSFVPTATGIGDLLLEVALWALVTEIAVTGAVYHLLRGTDTPQALLDRDLDGLELVGLLALVLLAYSATTSRPGRTVWRVVFGTAAFSPDRRPPDLEEPSPPVVTWGSRAVAAAAVVLVADVAWYLLTRTDLGPLLYALVEQSGTADGWSVDLRTGLSTVEAAALYGVLLLVGILVAVTLSVRR